MPGVTGDVVTAAKRGQYGRVMTRTPVAARAVVVGGVLLAAIAVVIRANAGAMDVAAGDSGATVPLWSVWLAALAGILVATLAAPRRRTAPVSPAAARPQAVGLTILALAFTALLLTFGVAEPTFTGGKLVLLVALPLLLMRLRPVPRTRHGATARHHLGALAAVAAWGVLTFLMPWSSRTSPSTDSVSMTDLVLILVVGFVVNAVIEEVFYRRWLQTRLQDVAGPWPAIVVTSVLFASWHVALGSAGGVLHRPGPDVLVDLAGALLNQGVIGVFLGFLWARYRLMWPILLAHGALNALPLIL